MSYVEWQAKVRNVLNKLGTNGTAAPDCKVPRGKGNDPDLYRSQYAAATEFMLASQVCSMFNKRKEDAKKLCEKLGVFDMEDTPFDELQPGDHARTNGQIQIAVKVNNDSEGYDIDIIKNKLMIKLGAKETDKIMQAARKDKRGAKTITATLSD